MSVPRLRFKDEDGRGFPEWEVQELGDVCSTFKSGTGITSDEINEQGDYPVFGGNGLRGYTNAFTHDGFFVLIGRQGALCGNINRSQGKAYISEHAIAVCGNKNAVTEWLAQRLDYLQLNRFSESSAQPGLSVNKLIKLKLTIPSLTEQTKIANFLTAIDEKITHLTRKHALLTQYKKGVMQQIFSQQLRFKDEDGLEFPEWKEKEIGEVFKVTRGNVLSMTLVNEAQSQTNPYPVYSSQTKNNGLSGFYRNYLYENCITWTTDGANAGDVNYRSGKFYCTNVCGVLVNADGYANACIAAMINSISRNYVSYVGNPKLMNGVMAKITISFPSLSEQTKIANFLTAIDDKLTAVQTQLNAMKQYKQGLLQQMFV